MEFYFIRKISHHRIVKWQNEAAWCSFIKVRRTVSLSRWRRASSIKFSWNLSFGIIKNFLFFLKTENIKSSKFKNVRDKMAKNIEWNEWDFITSVEANLLSPSGRNREGKKAASKPSWEKTSRSIDRNYETFPDENFMFITTVTWESRRFR